ncbi:hypothetical protein C2E23DRAFT_339236 [Lenzites betulinus]|nr:hypothetical protein C2E23DRAFT_339236 [Lenzites betulinus]
MAPYLCSICQDLHRLDHLRSLPCGHTFCHNCIKRCIDVAAGRRRIPDPNVLCPSCRRPFKGGQEHVLYLDDSDPDSATAAKPCHSDAVHARIQTAVREVNKVQDDLRLQTVQKAAQEVEKVVELSEGLEECHLSLLTAVAARWRNMLPMFIELNAKRNEALELREKLRRAKEERNAAVAERTHAEDIASQAIETTARAHRVVQDHVDKADALKKEIEQLKKIHKEELTAQQERLSMLTTNLGRHKAKEAKQKLELDKLRAENASLAASQLISLEVEDGDPELQLGNAQRCDMSGSQATFERLSSSSRKCKGSEDDFVVLESQLRESDDDEPVQHTPPVRLRKTSSKISLAPKPSVFRSDWQIPPEQVKQNGVGRMLQRPLSTSVSAAFPLSLDQKGRPLKPVQTGSRKRMRGLS